MFAVIGEIVVGLVLLALILAVLEVTKDAIGYVYGGFRIVRYAQFKASAWGKARLGFRNWLVSWRDGGGWFAQIDGMKVYHNGWRRVEPDEFIGA